MKYGIFKGKNLKNENEFIDNLIFDIWIVQLPNLSKIIKKDYENDEYKKKLYLLLKLFDQEAQNRNNKHRLLIIKKLFPKFLERIINRLKSADSDIETISKVFKFLLEKAKRLPFFFFMKLSAVY